MGKKKKEILDKEYEGFAQGMKDHGYSAAAVKTLWDILLPFSDYAFNRAHSAAYGVVSYWTAYLKANYPAEYMAAVLTSRPRRQGQGGDLPGRVPADGHHGAAAGRQRVGAQLRPGRRPTSGSAWARIRNVGVNVVDAIVAARKEKGAFTDFSDFLRKVDAVVCNKKVIESLIKAGAFDSLGHPRKGLLLVHADAIDAVMSTKKAASMGQFDLFGSMDGSAPSELDSVFDVKVPDDEWDTKHRLAVEREMLGLYVSGPPAARAWSRCSPPSRTRRSPRSWRATVGRGRPPGHHRRHPRRREPAGEQERRAVGVGAAGGPRRWHRGAVLPALPTRWSGSTWPRTRSCWSRPGSTSATTASR